MPKPGAFQPKDPIAALNASHPRGGGYSDEIHMIHLTGFIQSLGLEAQYEAYARAVAAEEAQAEATLAWGPV